jgi:hypothetical protein
LLYEEKPGKEVEEFLYLLNPLVQSSGPERLQLFHLIEQAEHVWGGFAPAPEAELVIGAG